MAFWVSLSRYISLFIKKNSINTDKREALIVFISGPSGVGKTTVEGKVLNFNKNWISLKSTTTRKKRNTEDFKSYNFVSVQKFKKLISENKFFFHIKGSYSDSVLYGFTNKDFKYAIENFSVVIINTYASGMKIMQKNLNKMGIKSISIFILPPSFVELKKRIQKRKSESEENIRKRLSKAKSEISHSKTYDYQVVNDNLKKTTIQIYKIICKNLKK